MPASVALPALNYSARIVAQGSYYPPVIAAQVYALDIFRAAARRYESIARHEKEAPRETSTTPDSRYR